MSARPWDVVYWNVMDVLYRAFQSPTDQRMRHLSYFWWFYVEGERKNDPSCAGSSACTEERVSNGIFLRSCLCVPNAKFSEKWIIWYLNMSCSLRGFGFLKISQFWIETKRICGLGFVCTMTQIKLFTGRTKRSTNNTQLRQQIMFLLLCTMLQRLAL